MSSDDGRTTSIPDTDRDAGSAEAALIGARRDKAERLRARGDNPFANDVKPLLGGRTLDIADARALAAAARDDSGYSESMLPPVDQRQFLHVRGRVVSLRSTGGLSFLRVRDRTGEIQTYVDQGQARASDALADMDVGDVVEVEGPLMVTRRRELSIDARRVRIVTKAYRPLPEKWHGLSDVELRYRQRYVDLIANPAVADVFRARTHIVRAARSILDERGFLEVETPSMHLVVGGAAARPFETHHNALDLDLYLRIAPELHLKRLLVGGLERVYEIARCYRNEGVSTRHNPEFTMLEFYEAYATYEDLLDFTEELVRGIDGRLAAAMPAAHAKWREARPFTLEQPFVRVSMERAVAAAAERTSIPSWKTAAASDGGAGIVRLLRGDFSGEIKDWAKSSPRAKALDWGNLRKGLGKCDSDGERLFALYEYLSEPFLADDYRAPDGARSVPVFVTDYPIEVSPLARRSDSRPELTDRFELFVHGRELCNAFSELNDPDDQAARFRAQVERKARGDEETMDYDADYIRALEHGMPPAAGFGMGIDRLVMMLTHCASIRDVILFPLLRPEAGPP